MTNLRSPNLSKTCILTTSELLSDFCFVVDNREVKVHKAILAGESTLSFRQLHCSMTFFYGLSARSPVFEWMFNGNFRVALVGQQKIEDISAEVFEDFLHFLYSGELRSDAHVYELILVADRYEVMDLVKVCEKKLLKNINSENAEKIFRIANQIEYDSVLKEVSFKILQS